MKIIAKQKPKLNICLGFSTQDDEATIIDMIYGEDVKQQAIQKPILKRVIQKIQNTNLKVTKKVGKLVSGSIQDGKNQQVSEQIEEKLQQIANNEKDDQLIPDAWWRRDPSWITERKESIMRQAPERGKFWQMEKLSLLQKEIDHQRMKDIELDKIWTEQDSQVFTEKVDSFKQGILNLSFYQSDASDYGITEEDEVQVITPKRKKPQQNDKEPIPEEYIAPRRILQRNQKDRKVFGSPHKNKYNNNFNNSNGGSGTAIQGKQKQQLGRTEMNSIKSQQKLFSYQQKQMQILVKGTTKTGVRWAPSVALIGTAAVAMQGFGPAAASFLLY